ncbi:mitochondrial pyruvate carrier 2-like isoform X2 [Fopius arisanus]|uniref:Mitochondrial pyruvate carrier n=1 Tax=Fopius arisanus TaxID=64838 RepID=A0A9R1U8Q3_9HYME|nr:PREDICTED: mitochondrial pyruvate carrier 2-like isoform X2 [Fopius arisanus]
MLPLVQKIFPITGDSKDQIKKLQTTSTDQKPNMTRYQKVMTRIASYLPEKVRPTFLHPAGPTTVFFWAPTFKWGLVLAGIGDINRAPETISLAQTASLMLTGIIWSRYSLVIVPKNWNLFSVNGFVSMTAAYNFYRGLTYQMANAPVSPKD